MAQSNTSAMAPKKQEESRTSIHDIKNDVVQLKEDVVAYGSDSAHQAMDAVRAGANQAIDKGKQAAEMAKDAQAKMRDYISEHPTASVLIAVGVGAILARMLLK